MTALKLDKFKDWLVQNGAEILIPTNEYELIRFRANNRVSIIYKSRRGTTFTGESEKAYECFTSSKPWSGGNRTTGTPGVATRTLLERDGNICFYCFQPMPPGDMTREHLLPSVHGGSNHLSNQVLAHRECNVKAGHLSLIKKIKIREQALLNYDAGRTPTLRD